MQEVVPDIVNAFIYSDVLHSSKISNVVREMYLISQLFSTVLSDLVIWLCNLIVNLDAPHARKDRTLLFKEVHAHIYARVYSDQSLLSSL